MKATACLSSTLLMFLACAVHAATPVSLRVQATGGDSHEDIKGSNESSHHQKKNVEATVSNMGKEPMEALTVKFYAFGRDQKTEKTVIFQTAEKKIAIEPGKPAMTPFEVTTTYTPEHFVSSRTGGGSGKKSRTTTKKVPGEGIRLIGYGVQVVQGGTVLAEDFQPRGLKDDLASTPAAAKETPKSKSKPKSANS